MSDAPDHDDYLRRLDDAVGPVAHGEFRKHQSRLIRRLGADEYATAYREYVELAGHYLATLDRGDTVNDLVVKMIRDLAATLVLPSPV